MEIIDVKATMLGDPTIHSVESTLIQVYTDENVTGIGEAHVHAKYGEGALAVKDIVEVGFKRVLLGEDPLDIQRLWEKLYDYTTFWGNRGFVTHAISGVDVALMDIAGKALKVPVHKLLGGCYRDKVRVYASALFNMENLGITVKEARRYVEEGFTAMKFGGSKSGFGRDPRNDMEVVRRIRETVGDDIDLMLDGPYRHWKTAKYAIKMIKKLEKFNIYWQEEPLAPDDIEGYVKVRDAVDTLIAAGERAHTRYEFKNLLVRGAIDVAQPDIAWVGGLTEAKKIADLTHLWGVITVPHNWSTAINVLSGLHLVASMPTGILLEYPIGPRTNELMLKGTPSPLMTEILAEPFEVKKSYIEVPKKPGLGIELNEEAVKKYTHKG